MAILSGCQEGKATPRLAEVKCPACGELLEIFVRMGGKAGAAGTLAEDAVCEKCGFTAAGGTPAASYSPYE